MKSLSCWLLSVIISGLVLATGHPAEADRGTFANKRAIMDGDIEGWTQPSEIDRRLKRIKAAGFNVYMPAVWYGRGTTWPSKYAPWDFALERPLKPNFDPLKYAIEKAHAMGLEVHPWFTVTLRWKQLGAIKPVHHFSSSKSDAKDTSSNHNYCVIANL